MPYDPTPEPFREKTRAELLARIAMLEGILRKRAEANSRAQLRWRQRQRAKEDAELEAKLRAAEAQEPI